MTTALALFPGGIVGALLSAALAVSLGIGAARLIMGDPAAREIEALTVLLRVCDRNTESQHPAACICQQP